MTLQVSRNGQNITIKHHSSDPEVTESAMHMEVTEPASYMEEFHRELGRHLTDAEDERRGQPEESRHDPDRQGA